MCCVSCCCSQFEDVVQDFFSDPTWLDAWNRADLTPAAGRFGSGKEACRLRQCLGPQVWDAPETVLFEIGLDWVQPFDRAYSSIIWTVCADLNEMDLRKNYNIRPLAIIPGPCQPANVDVFLERTLNVFKESVDR
jgi:hypothetical protein